MRNQNIFNTCCSSSPHTPILLYNSDRELQQRSGSKPIFSSAFYLLQPCYRGKKGWGGGWWGVGEGFCVLQEVLRHGATRPTGEKEKGEQLIVAPLTIRLHCLLCGKMLIICLVQFTHAAVAYQEGTKKCGNDSHNALWFTDAHTHTDRHANKAIAHNLQVNSWLIGTIAFTLIR